MRALPGARFSVPEPLVEGGNNLLDVPMMKQYLLAAMEGRAGRGDDKALPLTEASARSSQRLMSLRNWADDPALCSELGPEWFYTLNDFTFLEPGQFPRVDLLLGFHTKNPEVTRQEMRKLEPALLEAVTQWGADHPTTGAALAPVFGEMRMGGDKGGKGEIVIRYFQSPRLPGHLRPAWTVAGDYLLIDLSPEMLTEAIRRAESAGKPAASENLAALQGKSGMNSFHSFQIIRLRKISAVLVAVLSPIMRRMDPKFDPLQTGLAPILESIDSITFLRQGGADGVRMVGDIRMLGKENQKK